MMFLKLQIYSLSLQCSYFHLKIIVYCTFLVSPKKSKIKVNPDQWAQSNYNWRKQITVQKAQNLRRTFGGRFLIRGQQTLILGATPLARRNQKCNL